VTKNPDGCPPGPGNQLLIKVISPLCTTALWSLSKHVDKVADNICMYIPITYILVDYVISYH
jgi:hypothetical protein